MTDEYEGSTDMQRNNPFSLAGLLAAIVASVPLAFFIGVGGAIVTAMAGAIASLATKAALLHVQQAQYRATFGEQQLEGILDSSQLDSPRIEPPAPPRHLRLVPMIVSLVVTLGAAGIVVAITGGVGFNLALEDPLQPSNPQTSTQQQNTKPSPTQTEPVDTEQDYWQPDDSTFGQVTESYYGNDYDMGYDTPIDSPTATEQNAPQPDASVPTQDQTPVQTTEPVVEQPLQEQAPTVMETTTTTEATVA